MIVGRINPEDNPNNSVAKINVIKLFIKNKIRDNPKDKLAIINPVLLLDSFREEKDPTSV